MVLFTVVAALDRALAMDEEGTLPGLEHQQAWCIKSFRLELER
ncbi:hypothetical protein RS9917_13738 [Synechococcus sp. RS9917]|nr:hypothetical protein RS9917_13738 [Synechococcus sp. RS9917]